MKQTKKSRVPMYILEIIQVIIKYDVIVYFNLDLSFMKVDDIIETRLFLNEVINDRR